MDFSLSIEERDVQMWVRTFVDREIRPLEEEALRNEWAGRTGVEPETIRALQLKAREAGFWGGADAGGARRYGSECCPSNAGTANSGWPVSTTAPTRSSARPLHETCSRATW